MTKEEAFRILEEATARLQLVRQDHVTIVRALDVIKEILEIK